MRRLTKINLKKIGKSGTVNTLLTKQPRRWKINVKLFRDSLVESFPIYCFCHKKKLFSCSTKHHYIIHFQFIDALSQWIMIMLRFTYSHPNKALVLWFVFTRSCIVKRCTQVVLQTVNFLLLIYGHKEISNFHNNHKSYVYK